MKRGNLLVAIFFVSLLVLLGSQCSPKPTASKEVTIGAILPLTGALASLGEPERNALLLAVEDAKQSGVPINLIVEDSKGSAPDGVAAMNKLIAQGVKAVIVSATGINRAVLPVADQNKILIFTQCMDPTITSESKYAFRIFPNYVEEQKLTVEFLKNKGYRRVGLYSANNAGIKPESDAFKRFAAEAGVQIVFDETFEMTQNDFKNVLLRVKSQPPDAILILGYGQNYPPILKQIKELNINTPVIGNVALEQESATQGGTENFEGVVFPSFSAGQQNGAINNFRSRYFERYGKYPGGFLDYPYFYDALMVMGQVLNKENGDVERAVSALNDQSFKGLSGDLKFSTDGDAFPPLALAVYRAGKVEPLQLSQAVGK
jgi:branched-chain amino acid transport system substrate-binding protein